MAERKPNPKQPSSTKNQFLDLLREGTRVLQQGQISQAVNLLKQAHGLKPTDEAVALNLGGAYILAKKFKQAIDVLEPLADQQSDNPMVWTNLGAAYLGNPVLATDEKQQRAIAAFKQALEIDAETPNVAYNLGLIYRDRKEQEQALYWFKQALQTNPNDKDARHYVETLQEESE